MQVDFNNLRKMVLRTHDDLVRVLNRNLAADRLSVTVDVSEISGILNELRSLIGIIAMCHDKQNPDMAEVYSEFYPDGACLAVFNPEVEEEA